MQIQLPVLTHPERDAIQQDEALLKQLLVAGRTFEESVGVVSALKAWRAKQELALKATRRIDVEDALRCVNDNWKLRQGLALEERHQYAELSWRLLVCEIAAARREQPSCACDLCAEARKQIASLEARADKKTRRDSARRRRNKRLEERRVGH